MGFDAFSLFKRVVQIAGNPTLNMPPPPPGMDGPPPFDVPQDNHTNFSDRVLRGHLGAGEEPDGPGGPPLLPPPQSLQEMYQVPEDPANLLSYLGMKDFSNGSPLPPPQMEDPAEANSTMNAPPYQPQMPGLKMAGALQNAMGNQNQPPPYVAPALIPTGGGLNQLMSHAITPQQSGTGVMPSAPNFGVPELPVSVNPEQELAQTYQMLKMGYL
jgi:hypothetical protein